MPSTVGEIAAHQRQQIDQGGVGRVLAVGEGVVEQELLGQVEDQQAAHAVVGEALPHLGEEQHGRPRRVAAQLQQDGNPGQDRDDDPGHHDDIEHQDGPA